MDIQELKIVLKLLGQKDYTGTITEIMPNHKIKVSTVRNLCEKLFNRQYLDIEEKIVTLKITSAGKKLLQKKNLPEEFNPLVLTLLKACGEKNTVKPSEIKISPASKRNQLIETLIEKGLIDIAEQEIYQVSLTQEAQEFLAKEFLPEGNGNITLSKQLLINYLVFLRKYLP